MISYSLSPIYKDDVDVDDIKLFHVNIKDAKPERIIAACKIFEGNFGKTIKCIDVAITEELNGIVWEFFDSFENIHKNHITQYILDDFYCRNSILSVLKCQWWN